ncbi:MAG: hypothetical protein JRI36_11230, partial [Deltaproteobacteria bacterium]|nr:hypothetical protein [Deltaproteobacteria bacterium]
MACHNPNLIVETDSVDPPSYDPSTITPTPHACENCHWPTNCNEVLPPRLDLSSATWDVGKVVTGVTGTTCNDNASMFESGSSRTGSTWNTWPDANPGAIPANGFPRPSVVDFVGNEPAPIMANGYMQYGTLEATKAFKAVTGTHHEVGVGLVLSGNVYNKCYSCHAADPDSPVRTKPYLPEYEYYIRYCENCHDTQTLHIGISEHVTDGPSTNRALSGNCTDVLAKDKIYTVGGGVLDQCVTANQKCVACHGDVLSTLPDPEPDKPNLEDMAPGFGSPGIIVQLHGSYFGPEKLSDNWVRMRRVSGTGTEYVDVPIYSWSENLIEIFVPGGSFWPSLPYGSQIKVKASGGVSNMGAFVVRKHPEIDQLTPPAGTWTTKVTVDGKGFYVKQQKIYTGTLTTKDGYGF